MTAGVVAQLTRQSEIAPEERTICLTGLPDHLHHAYAFRNAFPGLSDVLLPGRPVRAYLEGEGRPLLAADGECGAAVVLAYRNGTLVLNP